MGHRQKRVMFSSTFICLLSTMPSQDSSFIPTVGALKPQNSCFPHSHPPGFSTQLVIHSCPKKENWVSCSDWSLCMTSQSFQISALKEDQYGAAAVVGCLPTIHKALGSNPNTEKETTDVNLRYFSSFLPWSLPGGLLPSPRPHLLEVLQLPHTAPPARDQVYKHELIGEGVWCRMMRVKCCVSWDNPTYI